MAFVTRGSYPITEATDRSKAFLTRRSKSFGTRDVMSSPTSYRDVVHTAMVARSILARRLRQPTLQVVARRYASTSPLSKQKSLHASGSQHPIPEAPKAPAPEREESWLTRKVKSSPTALKAFTGMATVLGYNSPKQVAGRHAYQLYDQLCVPRADEEQEFWQDGELATCALRKSCSIWVSALNISP